jgi:hypothetical protein
VSEPLAGHSFHRQQFLHKLHDPRVVFAFSDHVFAHYLVLQACRSAGALACGIPTSSECTTLAVASDDGQAGAWHTHAQVSVFGLLRDEARACQRRRICEEFKAWITS